MRERASWTRIQTNGLCLLRLEVFLVVFGTVSLFVEAGDHGAAAERVTLRICFFDTLKIFLGYEGLISWLLLMSYQVYGLVLPLTPSLASLKVLTEGGQIDLIN